MHSCVLHDITKAVDNKLQVDAAILDFSRPLIKLSMQDSSTS